MGLFSTPGVSGANSRCATSSTTPRSRIACESVPPSAACSSTKESPCDQRLSKHFGATLALDDVDFDVGCGEIHAVVGENGAGKSTLIRILSGVHRADRGQVVVDGVARQFASP